MATISLTVGSITVKRTIPDERAVNILTTAFNPPEEETPSKRLAFCLNAMIEQTRTKAMENRSYELRRKAIDDANTEFELGE